MLLAVFGASITLNEIQPRKGTCTSSLKFLNISLNLKAHKANNLICNIHFPLPSDAVSLKKNTKNNNNRK